MNSPSLTLPEPIERLRPLLAQVVERLETKSPYAAAWLGDCRGYSISVDRQEELVSEEEPAAGVVLTAFDGRTLRERAVGSFTAQDVESEARTFGDSLPPLDGGSRLELANGLTGRHDFRTDAKMPPERLSLAEKIDHCRELQDRLRQVDPRVVNVRIVYQERAETSVFRNRESDLAQQIYRMRVGVFVIVREGETTRWNWRFKSAAGGWESIQYDDEELSSVVEMALRLLEAGRVDPGEYEVVTAPGVSGVLAHESFGHGVETDMFVKERARAALYLNQRVGSPLVDIFDDPSLPGAYGMYFFDDEGYPARRTQIVEKGIFRSGLSDLSSATILGVPRTGNGRRQDYGRKAYARMSNTFFGPGDSSFEDLIAAADNGVYLHKWNSGMEDPQGWGIQVTCHIGQEIKNGRLTGRYFTPVVVSGYVPDVLQTIRGVTGELVTEGGWCGKGHKETVFVSSGGPHLWLRAKLG